MGMLAFNVPRDPATHRTLARDACSHRALMDLDRETNRKDPPKRVLCWDLRSFVLRSHLDSRSDSSPRLEKTSPCESAGGKGVRKGVRKGVLQSAYSP
jgi:hypothetical protein